MKRLLCLSLSLSILTILSVTACNPVISPSTVPSVETAAPTESTAPAITTVPTAESTLPPSTDTPTAPPPETTEAPIEPTLDPSLLDSPAYQRITSLFNAEHFDPAALVAFARWIDSQPDFMEQYPEGWELRQLVKGPILTCYSPRSEDSRRYGFWIEYVDSSGTLNSCETPYELFAMDVSRDWVVNMVHNAKDPIGVPENMKEAFADFLIYHDMYPTTLFWPGTELEMYFDWKTYSTEDFITLFIKYYDDTKSDGGYFIASAFFNGIHLLEGWLDYPADKLPPRNPQ